MYKEENSRVPRPKCPCKNCSDRKVGCHSTCKSYNEYLTDNDNYNHIVHERKYKQEMINDVCIGKSKAKRIHK